MKTPGSIGLLRRRALTFRSTSRLGSDEIVSGSKSNQGTVGNCPGFSVCFLDSSNWQIPPEVVASGIVLSSNK